MKTCIVCLTLIVLLGSCKKIEDNDTVKTYSSSKGTTINLYTIDWRTTNSSNTNGNLNGYSFLGINLTLVGATNGDSIKIRTFGDGLNGYSLIPLDAEKRFNNDIQISFLMVLTPNVPQEQFTKSTTLFVFKGTDTLKVTLNSEPLKY